MSQIRANLRHPGDPTKSTQKQDKLSERRTCVPLECHRETQFEILPAVHLCRCAVSNTFIKAPKCPFVAQMLRHPTRFLFGRQVHVLHDFRRRNPEHSSDSRPGADFVQQHRPRRLQVPRMRLEQVAAALSGGDSESEQLLHLEVADGGVHLPVVGAQRRVTLVLRHSMHLQSRMRTVSYAHTCACHLFQIVFALQI